jgi:hypothetical protein
MTIGSWAGPCSEPAVSPWPLVYYHFSKLWLCFNSLLVAWGRTWKPSEDHCNLPATQWTFKKLLLAQFFKTGFFFLFINCLLAQFLCNVKEAYFQLYEGPWKSSCFCKHITVVHVLQAAYYNILHTQQNRRICLLTIGEFASNAGQVTPLS